MFSPASTYIRGYENVLEKSSPLFLLSGGTPNQRICKHEGCATGTLTFRSYQGTTQQKDRTGGGGGRETNTTTQRKSEPATKNRLRNPPPDAVVACITDETRPTEVTSKHHLHTARGGRQIYGSPCRPYPPPLTTWNWESERRRSALRCE